MKDNRVKRVMREGGLAIVSHIGFSDPAVVEIIAAAGFDGAFIDMEHSAFDMKTVGEMIRVADLCGITPIVRVPENNPKTILRILDAGAQGIQVPRIEGVDGALRAVAAVRHPPVGDRGGDAGLAAPRGAEKDEPARGRRREGAGLVDGRALDSQGGERVEGHAAEGAQVAELGQAVAALRLEARQGAGTREDLAEVGMTHGYVAAHPTDVAADIAGRRGPGRRGFIFA